MIPVWATYRYIHHYTHYLCLIYTQVYSQYYKHTHSIHISRSYTLMYTHIHVYYAAALMFRSYILIRPDIFLFPCGRSGLAVGGASDVLRTGLTGGCGEGLLGLAGAVVDVAALAEGGGVIAGEAREGRRVMESVRGRAGGDTNLTCSPVARADSLDIRAARASASDVNFLRGALGDACRAGSLRRMGFSSPWPWYLARNIARPLSTSLAFGGGAHTVGLFCSLKLTVFLIRVEAGRVCGGSGTCSLARGATAG